jgi:hypothetical protein
LSSGCPWWCLAAGLQKPRGFQPGTKISPGAVMVHDDILCDNDYDRKHLVLSTLGTTLESSRTKQNEYEKQSLTFMVMIPLIHKETVH